MKLYAASSPHQTHMRVLHQVGGEEVGDRHLLRAVVHAEVVDVGQCALHCERIRLCVCVCVCVYVCARESV